MNAHALAAATYGNPSNVQKTARTAEYQVIARITARLQRAQAERTNGFAALAEALTENRRLWTEFAIDLTSAENALPDALKLQLLQLAQFSLRHTENVLRSDASADVLIDINLAIMRGLSGKDDTT